MRQQALFTQAAATPALVAPVAATHPTGNPEEDSLLAASLQAVCRQDLGERGRRDVEEGPRCRQRVPLSSGHGETCAPQAAANRLAARRWRTRESDSASRCGKAR